MRSTIGLLLLGALTLAGCDRQSQGAQQANETASVASPPAKSAGTLDRSHKGEAAPATPFTDPKGDKTTLAAFRGKPVLLNLWATWCAPCVKEMPTLDKLAGSKAGALTVIALSQDFEGAAKVKPFFANSGFATLQPYLDTDAAFSTGMSLNLPTTILYDSRGREVWRKLGDTDWASAEAAKLVAEAG